MLAPPMALYSERNTLGNLHPDPSALPVRARTFTRLARTNLPAQSPASFLLTNTLLLPTPIQRPTRQDTTSRIATIDNNHNSSGPSIGSDNNINREMNGSTSVNGNGLNRFRASSSSPLQPSNDFLVNKPSIDPGQHFTALRHVDRADAQRTALSFLQGNILQPSSPASEKEQPAVTGSKPTFTRITKPRFNAFGSPKSGLSGSLLVDSHPGSRSNSISHSDNDSNRSYSPSLQEDSASASPSASSPTSLSPSPTSSLSPSPPALSLRLEEPQQQKPPTCHGPAKAQVPSLSLSLSSSFLSPPSAVPSLLSASSHSSSSCSSLSSLTSPPSPPTHFHFPETVDRYGWSQQRPVLGDLLCVEEPKSGKDPLVETKQGLESGEKDTLLLGGGALERLSDSEGEASRDRSLVTDSRMTTNCSCSDNNSNDNKGCTSCSLAPQQQRRISSRGFEQVKPGTTLQNRIRAPSPPSVVTGFCCFSAQSTSGGIDGEPSPRDFLGEADLPYPLPSTLQERLARQRKRDEQLRQLKLREEREARENRRKTRQRRASFTAGIIPHPPSFPLVMIN